MFRLKKISVILTLLLIIFLILGSILIAQEIVDSDNDGISDEKEKEIGTNPNKYDTDGDGLSDGKEYLLDINPLKFDTDGDGLSDGMDIVYGTDPLKFDTDGDGLSDGKEILLGFNPKSTDTDGNGTPDNKEKYTKNYKDTDGDGIPDDKEILYGTNSKKLDTDGDELSDGKEILVGTNPLSMDTDGDGVYDGKEILLGTDPRGSTQSKNKNTDDKDKKDASSYEISILLQKGTTISGTVELKDDSITIYNKIDGIDYEKKLSLNDIKSIEILEWNPYISSNSTDKSSQEIEYTFYPSKYKIKLNDGTVYYQKTRFKNLDVLSLETKYGKTIIYFIFVDYWVVKSKNEGIWSNSGLTDFDANNKNPNPLTAIRLDVIKNITKDEKN